MRSKQWGNCLCFLRTVACGLGMRVVSCTVVWCVGPESGERRDVVERREVGREIEGGEMRPSSPLKG